MSNLCSTEITFYSENRKNVASFIDEVIIVEKGDVVYTDVVKGKASRIPDALFVKALLYNHADDISHLSDKVKAVLDRDVPQEILEERKKYLDKIKKAGK